MESKTRSLKIAFKITIIYVIVSVIWFLLGKNIKGFINNIYIINTASGTVFVFFAVYMISSRFRKDKIIIKEYSNKLDKKTHDLENLDLSLNNHRRFIESLLESADILIILLDENFKILEASNNIEVHTSYTEKELAGRSLYELLKKEDIEEIKENLIGRNGYILELELDTKCGKKKHMSGDIKRVKDIQNEKIEYTMFLSDISKRKFLEERVTYLGSYDPITSLPNRISLEKKFKSILEEADKTGNIIAFLYIDIDDFAYINETLGHHAGDSLLRDMAVLLRNSIENTDILSRIIQDQFAIICTDKNSIEDINKKVNKILKETKMDWEYGESRYMISNTIGISLYPQDGKDFTTLFKNANIALDSAKTDFRSGYNYYSPEIESSKVNDLTMLSEMKKALENKEIQMYYQPIQLLGTGEIDNAESLIRWFHPEKGYIPPDKFIPMAEKSGIIDEIGDYTLEEVFSQKKQWNEKTLGLKKVSVNISALSFSKEGFADMIKAKLEKYGLKGEEIVLELTETSFSIYTNKIKENIEEVRKIGIEIAMDDFGTGYSSLARLKDLPIDYLKLDREFIVTLIEEDGEAIIKPLILLANALGQKVIAEGIESKEQYLTLKKIGCKYGQGYFIARPMPAENLVEFLDKEREED